MKKIKGPWAIWKQIGAVTGVDVNEQREFSLPANVAVKLTKHQAEVAKRLYGNVTVFDEVWIEEDTEPSLEEHKDTKTETKPEIPDFTKEIKKAQEKLKNKVKSVKG